MSKIHIYWNPALELRYYAFYDKISVIIPERVERS